MRIFSSLVPIALVGVLLILAGPGTASAEVPEPPSYWTGPMRGEVPATLAGGHVIGTDELAALLRTGKTVLVDVADPLHRPANLAPAALWSPPAHQVIEGSTWLPGAGAGVIDENSSDLFRQDLASLTDNAFDRAIVLYCHPNCWASWNAAKRAIGFGYRNVHWYPEGLEGWRDAGKPLATAVPRALQRSDPR